MSSWLTAHYWQWVLSLLLLGSIVSVQVVFLDRFLLFRFMLFSYLQIHGGFIALFVGSVRFVFKLTCRCYWIGCPDYTRLPLRLCGGTASSAFAVPRFGSPVFCFASRFSIVNPRHATTLGSSLWLDSSLSRILSRIAVRWLLGRRNGHGVHSVLLLPARARIPRP